MIQKDLVSRLAFLRGSVPVVLTNLNTAQVTQIIDMTDLLALVFVIQTGAVTDADVTSTLLIEHGDASNLSDAAAVPDAELLPAGANQEAAAAISFSDDNVVKVIGYAGTKRYVRATLTPANNNAGDLPIAIVAIGLKRQRGFGGF
jgi:hypothetical protein